MRTCEIASPKAAQRYFNDSIVGRVSMLLAEALGGVRGGKSAARRGGSHAPAVKRGAKPAVAPRRGWLDRLDAWFWRLEQKERETYLARSRDVFDLERRIDALDREAVTRYY